MSHFLTCFKTPVSSVYRSIAHSDELVRETHPSGFARFLLFPDNSGSKVWWCCSMRPEQTSVSVQLPAAAKNISNIWQICATWLTTLPRAERLRAPLFMRPPTIWWRLHDETIRRFLRGLNEVRMEILLNPLRVIRVPFGVGLMN